MQLLPSIQAIVVTAGSSAEAANDRVVLPVARCNRGRVAVSEHAIAVPTQHAIWIPKEPTGRQQAVHVVIKSCASMCARVQHAKDISNGLRKNASNCARQARYWGLQNGQGIGRCEQAAHVEADCEAAQNKQQR